MDSAYVRLRTVARQLIAALPPPDFYRHFQSEVELSQTLFDSHRLIRRLSAAVRPVLDDNFGHCKVFAWFHSRMSASIDRVFDTTDPLLSRRTSASLIPDWTPSRSVHTPTARES